MIYPPEEKKRLEAVLNAFRDYISQHHFFDILYSPKRGYIHLTLEKNFIDATLVLDADHLFRLLFIEITNDVQDLFICGEHPNGDLWPDEIVEIRRRMMKCIELLPEDLRSHYTEVLKVTLEHCNDDAL